jgi:hypothetical protein
MLEKGGAESCGRRKQTRRIVFAMTQRSSFVLKVWRFACVGGAGAEQLLLALNNSYEQVLESEEESNAGFLVKSLSSRCGAILLDHPLHLVQLLVA